MHIICNNLKLSKLANMHPGSNFSAVGNRKLLTHYYSSFSNEIQFSFPPDVELRVLSQPASLNCVLTSGTKNNRRVLENWYYTRLLPFYFGTPKISQPLPYSLLKSKTPPMPIFLLTLNYFIN